MAKPDWRRWRTTVIAYCGRRLRLDRDDQRPSPEGRRSGSRPYWHEVDEGDSPEAQLLALGTAADATGRSVLELDEAPRRLLLEAFPRNGFKREFAALFRKQAKRKPDCVVAEYLRSGVEERIAAAPFDD